jgi:hypothetical protein
MYTKYNSEYEPRKEVYLRDIPKNHMIKIKNVKFEWTDYKVYEKLGCLPYERMTIQCLNKHGINMLFKDIDCRDISNHFQNCVKINHILGRQKRVNPEHFANNIYSRERPSFE